MADTLQMVPGFNHNVKHRGKAYHVQTEDSGVANPRIITHLFLGGNILASKKTSYGELVAADDLKLMVRELMEEQHKDVLRNLVCGVYDDVDEDARAYQPGQLAVEEEQPSPEAPQAEAPAPQPMDVSMLPDLLNPVRPPIAASILPDLTAPVRPQMQIAASVLPDLSAPSAASLPSLAAGSAAAAPPGPPLMRRDRPDVRPPVLPPIAAAAPAADVPAGRAPRGGSIVEMLRGEDLLSEKSLDEVILSYLAEEPKK